MNRRRLSLRDPETLESLGMFDEADELLLEMRRRKKDIAEANFLAEKARHEDLTQHLHSYLAYVGSKKT